MSELEQLKKHINDSGTRGMETAHVREDYEPAGDIMMMLLLESGEYVQRRFPAYTSNSKWFIYKKGFEPY